MCDTDPGHTRAGSALSRRRLLQGMVALAALAGCGPEERTTSAPSRSPRSSPSPAPAQLSAYVMAMHLHASTSEGTGSVRSHLAEAFRHGYDVAWFTEHDWRRRRLLYRPTFSFVPEEQMMGGAWSVLEVPTVGEVAGDSGGALVPNPVSPSDPAARKASLRLQVTSRGDSPATVGHRIRAEGGSRANYRSRIAGRTVSVDVLPTSTGPDAWGQVCFLLSHHPASGDRPAGQCALVYRLRTDGSDEVSSQGATGYVDRAVRAGEWQSLTFDLVADVARVWPDMDARDNSLNDIRFQATSRRGARAEVLFGYLRLDEQASYDAVGVEQDLVDRYAKEVPDVLGLIGSEISLGPHLNGYGGEQAPYDYGPISRLGDKPGYEALPSIVAHIHRSGGLASINHPSITASGLLAMNAGGADLIEVGYGHSGPAAIQRQLDTWDTLSRNGLFLTGNGASDDHTGQDWQEEGNRYYTAAWSNELAQPALLDALSRGRTFTGYLGSFAGTIDMTVDDTVPMGSVVVAPATARTLRLDVTGLPDGGAVHVIRGAVDHAGTADPTPGTTVVKSLGATDLARAPSLPLDVSGDCFHRIQVTDRAGAVVAYGQPIWLLGAPPAGGVPSRRRPA
ncbi:MAG: hypothetical protein JWQ45_1310 [Blastococcus sp.]|nr:hypothetical protein [Blastococcus sp.]